MADTIFSKGYSFGATDQGDYDIRAFEKKYGGVKMPNRNKSEGLAPWVLRMVQGNKGFAVRVTHTQGERPRVKDVYVSKEAMDWIVGFQEELKEGDSSKVNHGLDPALKDYLDAMKDWVKGQFDYVCNTLTDHGKTLLQIRDRVDGHDQDIRDLRASRAKMEEKQKATEDTVGDHDLKLDDLARQLREEREARERQERVWDERFRKATKRGPFGL